MQAAASDPLVVDAHDACLFLNVWSASLPAPANQFERIFLRALLIEFAAEWGAAVHARVHRLNDEKTCSFVPETFLRILWKTRDVTPAEAFRTWADKFCAELSDRHPRSVAARAAAMIRHEYKREWTVAALAHHVRLPPRQLSQEFRREYGMTVSAYLRLIRLAFALPRIRTEKIEAVALDVGYRSKKNFYHAFKQLTGLSPTEFRLLPAWQADEIIDLIRRKL